jgi:aminoglycoside phosphotransferase (APT) family kinase protein
MHEELIRPERLGPALAATLGDDRWRSLTWELIAGGKSNLTFLIRSDAGELVLRRPPTGNLLPSAHDMSREARVQAALGPSGLPVPNIVLADGGELIGVQGYVMNRVPGHVIRAELPPDYATTEASRRALAWAFVDNLARLHSVDPEAVGLADYGRPDGYLARQVRRWNSQWERSQTHDVPEVTELGRRLTLRMPEHHRAAIVHGDYRIDNLVFHPTDPGTVNAILDWELSTLGDPLTDLGLLMLFWRAQGDPVLSLIPGISHLPGMPDRTAMLDRYAAASGTDLGDMAFYQAFAHFKFAVIAQGVSARSRAGATAGQDFGDLDEEVRGLGARGLEHV